MQGHDDCKLLLMRQFLQNGQQFDLALYVQKGCRLVQQKHLRLLTDCPRQQNALPLPIADAVEVAVSQMRRAHQLQRILHLFFVLGRKDAQPPGVGDAPRRCKLKAGSQLGAAGVGQHQRQLLRPGVAGNAGKFLPVQQHRAAQRGQLPG